MKFVITFIVVLVICGIVVSVTSSESVSKYEDIKEGIVCYITSGGRAMQCMPTINPPIED